MRLSTEQQNSIRDVIRRFFGAKSRVMLFGSRVHDLGSGGDIDLYVEPEITDATEVVDAKFDALVELHKVLGEQKIDLVINRKNGYDLPIYTIAKETGVLL